MENIKITLPDYKKIAAKVQRNKVLVEQGEIEQALTWLQKSRAKFSQIKRPAQKGDFIEIEYSCQGNDSRAGYGAENDSQRVKDKFVLGQAKLAQGFEDNLVGMSAGKEKEFSLSGRKFKVKVISVQKMELPEINDELAKGLGEFKNLQELKTSIEQGINKEKEIAESQKMQQEILEKITKAAKIDLPAGLVESEKNKMINILKQELNQKLKIGLSDYLKKINKTEEQISHEFLPRAKKRLKNGLVLKELAQKEGISATDQEVEQAVNDVLKNYPDIKTAQKKLDINQLKSYIRDVIGNNKTLAKLESYNVSS